MKHQDKTPKYLFDEHMFPKLKSPPTITSDTSTESKDTTTATTTTTVNTVSKKNIGDLKPKVDLKAIQAEFKKSLTTDFTKLIDAAMNNFQGLNESFL